MKVVLNKCYGGFSISELAAQMMAANGSEQAQKELSQRGCWHGYGYVDGMDGYDRTDPLLVEAVEALGEDASGSLARLRVVEIPDGIEWEISEYDGIETILEAHRSW